MTVTGETDYEMKGRVLKTDCRQVCRRFLVLCCLLLAGCVSIPADFKEPRVTLISIAPRIQNLFAPEFDLVLRIANPNRTALDIVGLSYTLHLQGIQLVQGVATDLPEIAAYGETDVGLSATADLSAALGLLADLMQRPGEKVDFDFNAAIDLGTFYPMVNIRRTGAILLQ